MSILLQQERVLIQCPDCNGRGYYRCPCWPGDCLCGQDDQDCETCDGTGWLDPDDEY